MPVVEGERERERERERESRLGWHRPGEPPQTNGNLPGAWRNETFEYVQGSHSDYWDPKLKAESRRLAEVIELRDPPAAVVGDGSTMMASADPESVPTADPRTI